MILLGPRLKYGQVGGATLLFEETLSEIKNIRNDSDDIVVIATNIYPIFFNFLYVIYKLIGSFKKNNCYLVHSSRDYLIFIPVIFIFSKLSGGTLCLRKFGQEILESINGGRGLFEKIFSRLAIHLVDILHVETKFLVSNLKSYISEVHWMPNSRKPSSFISSPYFSGKGVFVGRISKKKGIDDIIKLASDYKVNIDLYGPLTSDFALDDLNIPGVSYLGLLGSDDIYKTLSKYDYFILPSYQEGYPGVVIESMACGIPSICYNVGGLSEMLEHGVNGFLIEPSNIKKLYEAILSLESNYYQLHLSSLLSYEKYNSEEVVSNYLKIISDYHS